MEILKKEKILFVQTAFLGDAILTLPAIQEYKKAHPDSQINILCIPSSSSIFKASPYVDNIIVLDKKGEHKGIFSFLNFTKKIKSNKFNRIFSFHRSFRTSLLVLMSGVKNTTGFSNSSLRYVYRNLVEYDPKIHEVKRNLFLAGFELKNDEWKIQPEMSDNLFDSESWLSSRGVKKGFIAVAPGTIWETKKYPSEYYRKIIKYLSADSKVILLGSKEDSELCESLVVNENVISLAGELKVTETVELLRRASFLISNDSAPSHMAMAAGKPVLMIYCSTVPDFGFYPYNQGSSWLSYEKLDCKPCGIHGYRKCPLGHFKCGFELIPEQVIKHINNNFIQYVRST